MSKQTEALKLALEQTLEMLSDNREYIEANERAEYLAMYDKAIAGAEKALAEQPAPAAQQEPERLLQEIARLHDRIKDLESDVEFLSQPAPVVNVQHKSTTYTERFTHAVAVLCGAQPPAELVAEWFEDVAVNGGHRLQNWVGVQHATPSWAQCIVVLDAAHVLANEPEEGEGHEAKLKEKNT